MAGSHDASLLLPIIRQILAAGARAKDVFMGVDVFKRNTFGGGGMNSAIAMEAAFQQGAFP